MINGPGLAYGRHSLLGHTYMYLHCHRGINEPINDLSHRDHQAFVTLPCSVFQGLLLASPTNIKTYQLEHSLPLPGQYTGQNSSSSLHMSQPPVGLDPLDIDWTVIDGLRDMSVGNDRKSQMGDERAREPQEANQPCSKPTTAGPETLPPLLRLPAELRNKIWELAVVRYPNGSDARLGIKIDRGARGLYRVPEPALLFTSKAIRSEAIGFYYHVNDFTIRVSQFDPAPCLLLGRKLRALQETYGIDLISKPVKLHANGHFNHWKNLKTWLRLRHDGIDTTNIDMSAAMDRSHRGEEKAAVGMMNMVSRMRSTPWEEVEPMIGLIARGAHIAKDYGM